MSAAADVRPGTCERTPDEMYTGSTVSVRSGAGRCSSGRICQVEVDSRGGRSAPVIYAWVEGIGRVPLSACLLRVDISGLPAGVLSGGKLEITGEICGMSPAWIEVCTCAWGAHKEVVCSVSDTGQVLAYDTDDRLRLPASHRQVGPAAVLRPPVAGAVLP